MASGHNGERRFQTHDHLGVNTLSVFFFFKHLSIIPTSQKVLHTQNGSTGEEDNGGDEGNREKKSTRGMVTRVILLNKVC